MKKYKIISIGFLVYFLFFFILNKKTEVKIKSFMQDQILIDTNFTSQNLINTNSNLIKENIKNKLELGGNFKSK